MIITGLWRTLLGGALALTLGTAGLPPATAAEGDAVSIPDSNFAQCITRKLGLAAGARVTEQQLVGITRLICDNYGISSIAGADKLIGLEELSLPHNQIGSIASLARLTNLDWVDLSFNKVSDLAPLTGLDVSLWLRGNQITDLSPAGIDRPGGRNSGYWCDYAGCRAVGATEQKISLAAAKVGVPFPLVVKGLEGDAVPLTVPAGASYNQAKGEVTYDAPGTYNISFLVKSYDDENSSFFPAFSGTITQQVMPAWSVSRVAGSSRYGTSAKVSKYGFPTTGVPVAYVSTGVGFPDALAGSAAAAFKGGPLLLVRLGSIPAEVKTELARLKPKRIVVQGSASVVSDSVLRQLKGYATSGQVTRNAGATRYDIAIVTSRNTWTAGAENVILANGSNFPDALSGGSLFAGHPGPVLLVPNSGGLPSAVAAEITRLQPKRVFLIGSVKAVSATVEAQLKAKGHDVIRLAGANRYSTSLAIAQHAYPAAGTADEVFVATGVNFPDGLSTGPLSAARRGPILLVNGTCLTPQAAAYLTKLAPSKMTLIGGSSVVGAGIEAFTICG